MIIQCREDTLNFICEYKAKEPYILELRGGYIDCFDKDWVFITLDTDQGLIDELSKRDAIYLIGIEETKTLIQRGINEIEKYIFLRKDEILWAASSFIIL